MSEMSFARLAEGVALPHALTGLLIAFTMVAYVAATAQITLAPRPRAAFFALYACVTASLALAQSGVVPPGDDAATAAHDATGSLERSVVFIQTPDMDRRFEAETVWRALKAEGVRAPGIEIVGSGTAPGAPEVRYFNEADRPIAQRVAAIAAANGLPGARVRPDSSHPAPHGQVELWYPR